MSLAKNTVKGLLILVGGIAAAPQVAWAHCDTMDGPVVTAAKQALEKGDVTPVLKWVRKDQEPVIDEAFKKTLAVRTKGADARELADMYFFETLVRIHRAGEGAPYTGLKPAGTPAEPVVLASDKALDSDSVDSLVKMVTDAVSTGIRQRFAKASATRKHADDSVEAGREFVESYVQYVHYVERIYNDATTKQEHHGEEKVAAPEHQHPAHE